MTHHDTDFPAAAPGPLFAQPADPFARSRTKPSPDEVLVASLIWRHRGRRNPIRIAKLKELTGFSERQIKGIVEQLVVTHKLRIGGSREEPAGYFIIETEEDLRVAAGPYRSQILAMLRRLRVLEDPHSLREFLGQLRLEADQKRQRRRRRDHAENANQAKEGDETRTSQTLVDLVRISLRDGAKTPAEVAQDLRESGVKFAPNLIHGTLNRLLRAGEVGRGPDGRYWIKEA